MSSSFDVVVIGAGAAGVAAGRVLAQAHVTFTILEARNRIGGRAHTLIRDGIPLDMGCVWLHAADHNVWRREAEAAGIELDATPPPWTRPRRWDAGLGEAFGAFSERIEAAADAPDRPASDYLEPGSRANEAINAICTYLNGVTLDRVSAHDYNRYDGAGGNVRSKIGYGGLITKLAAGLPVQFGVEARAIDHSDALVRIETNGGALEAKAVIICLPTPVVVEALRFAPAIPDTIALAAGLPLGIVDKVFIGYTPGTFPAGEQGIGYRSPSLTHPSYDIGALDRPVIEAFIAGPLAAELEREGPRDAQAFVMDDLIKHLGNDVRSKLKILAASDWGRDPLSRGSYSYAKPGFAEAREALSKPVADRLFFAGEACHPTYFGAAHGAAETGIAAARLALDHIGAAPHG